MRRVKLLLLLLCTVLLLPTGASFGYLPAQTTAEIYPGETASFSIYLFGTNESVKVTAPDLPPGWGVKVEPDRVNFPVTDGFRYIETRDGYRRIVPVQIRLESPLNATAGAYTVALNLREDAARSVTGSGVAVRQVHEVPLTATVAGQPLTEEVDRDREQTNPTGGIGITAPNENDPEGEQEADDFPTLLVGVLLFELLWGIVAVYLWKRRT